MRFVTVALAVVLSACAHQQTVSDRLFCGRSIPGGGTVSDAELAAFVDEIVEPRFPVGFTMWSARGEWRGGGEDVIVFEFIHPRLEERDRAVREIADAYRRRFRQEAVLRVTTPARMELQQ